MSDKICLKHFFRRKCWNNRKSGYDLKFFHMTIKIFPWHFAILFGKISTPVGRLIPFIHWTVDSFYSLEGWFHSIKGGLITFLTGGFVKSGGWARGSYTGPDCNSWYSYVKSPTTLWEKFSRGFMVLDLATRKIH